MSKASTCILYLCLMLLTGGMPDCFPPIRPTMTLIRSDWSGLFFFFLVCLFLFVSCRGVHSILIEALKGFYVTLRSSLGFYKLDKASRCLTSCFSGFAMPWAGSQVQNMQIINYRLLCLLSSFIILSSVWI